MAAGPLVMHRRVQEVKHLLATAEELDAAGLGQSERSSL